MRWGVLFSDQSLTVLSPTATRDDAIALCLESDRNETKPVNMAVLVSIDNVDFQNHGQPSVLNQLAKSAASTCPKCGEPL